MGWKTLKEKFALHDKCISVREGKIAIGSGYIPDALTVDIKTGTVRETLSFANFGVKYCPALMAASPDEILSALAATDTFDVSIPVYTYSGSDIIEHYCEETGWPNTTHDGVLMHVNTFSTDKNEVVGWARQHASLAVVNLREESKRLTDSIQRNIENLINQQTVLAKIELLYGPAPDTSEES